MCLKGEGPEDGILEPVEDVRDPLRRLVVEIGLHAVVGRARGCHCDGQQCDAADAQYDAGNGELDHVRVTLTEPVPSAC